MDPLDFFPPNGIGAEHQTKTSPPAIIVNLSGLQSNLIHSQFLRQAFHLADLMFVWLHDQELKNDMGRSRLESLLPVHDVFCPLDDLSQVASDPIGLIGILCCSIDGDDQAI